MPHSATDSLIILAFTGFIKSIIKTNAHLIMSVFVLFKKINFSVYTKSDTYLNYIQFCSKQQSAAI